MTVDKAIKTIEYMLERNPYRDDTRESLELAVEALKKIERESS